MDGAVTLSALRHELRAPANILVGMCWLLQRSGLTPLQQGYMSELQAAAERIVERLLGDDSAGAMARALQPVPEAAAESDARPVASIVQAADPLRDDAGWQCLRAQLTLLLEEADTDCLELASRHEGLLRGHLGPAYPALAEALRLFDFELALRLLSSP